MIISDKNFLVLGFSKSGKSSAKLIKKHGGNVYYFDDVIVDVNYKKISALENIKDLYCVIKSPGFPETHCIFLEIIEKRFPIISEIELGFYLCRAPLVAVTGTNGKTTTVTLLHKILSDFKFQSRLLGNIGTAFCEMADELSYSDCVTLEVSSFQLDYIINFKPHIAALLNISPDHLDRHKTMKNYIDAKMNIFKNMENTEYVVLNYDSQILQKYSERIRAQIYWFSMTKKIEKGCCIEGGDIVFLDKGKETICRLDDIKILGKHNVENTLCAITCAKLMNVSNRSIQKSVSEFMGLAHRIELIRTLNGVSFYNDSKGTNIDCTITAARAMDKKTAIILGGSSKGLNYDALFNNFPANIVHCFICGETANNMASAAKRSGYLQFSICENLQDAVIAAYKFMGNFGNVLLSPAAASFDAFKNYDEKGQFFKGIVDRLV